MNTQIEMCERQKLDSAKLRVLNLSKCVAGCFLADDQFGGLYELFRFWKRTADNSIGNSPQGFKTIIEYYREFAELLLERLDELLKKQSDHVLDELFRHLGWLGERLFSKKDFENKPLMADHDYYTEYDVLFDCLLSLGGKYEYEHPGQYPLIYFDAIMVVFREAEKAFLVDRDNTDLKHILFDLPHTYYKFAERAIEAGNNNGAMLAAVNLSKALDELLENGLNKEAADLAGLLVKIGLLAVAQKDKLIEENFLRKDIDEWVIDKLEETKLGAVVSEQIKEAYIESVGVGAHDEVWRFIKRLGNKLGTNFGFMFDWSTGEDYPQDDPRRK